jgi:hypothetical protein
MSKRRLLVGTKKGAVILTAYGTRQNWEITGHRLRAGRCVASKAEPQIPICIYAS